MLKMTRNQLTIIRKLEFKKIPKLTRAGIILLGLSSMFGVSLIYQFLFNIPMLLTAWTGIPVVVMVIFLHEFLHGLAFMSQGYKVKFGVAKDSGIGIAFYTTSPGSILSANEMYLVLVAPQFLTILALIYSIFTVDTMTASILVAFASYNLGGGCADLYSLVVLAKEKGKTYIEDTGTDAIIYRKTSMKIMN